MGGIIKSPAQDPGTSGKVLLSFFEEAINKLDRSADVLPILESQPVRVVKSKRL
jgi:hypothetical protein